MKTPGNPFWQKLLMIPLALALVAAPVCGQDNRPGGNETNQSATNEPAATNNTNNDPKAGGKKTPVSEEHTPVRIDQTGIHVGGPDPVDIGFNMSGMPEISSLGLILISLAAIILPFLFLIVAVACFFYFKHRRNRILHETLRQMLDKGVPIPPELIVPPERAARRKTRSDLRNGLVMLAIGFGTVIFLGKLGWIVVFVGVAFLIAWFVEKKDNPDNTGATTK